MSEPRAPAVTETSGGSTPAGRYQQLIRSAYHVIVRQGLQRVSIEDVAADAGVSRGLVSYHFGTKDNLLLETMRWAFLEMERRIWSSTTPEAAAPERLRALLDVLFVNPERNREFFLFYMELVEHGARLEQFKTLFPMIRGIVNRCYEDIVRQGSAEGTFDVADVERSAITVRVIIEGTFLQWIQEDDWVASHRRYRGACEDVLLRVLSATTSSPAHDA